MLSTLTELSKLEELWESFPEFDWEIQQNLRFLLGKLRERLNQNGDRYRPLLTQAYFSSDLFAEQRRDLEEDQQFKNAYRDLLKNPGACSFCSARTREGVKSVQEAKRDKKDLQEQYQKEKQERKRELTAQYCEKEKRQILEQLLEKPAEELKALFKKADVPMQTVLQLAEAWKALRQNEKANHAETIEVKIQGLWSEYRKEYQLFQQVERGRT